MCKGCNFNGASLQTHLTGGSLTQCKYFYSTSSNIEGAQSSEVNQQSTGDERSTGIQEPDVNEQINMSQDATQVQGIRSETEFWLREMDIMRAKLINDDLSKFEKRDLANFLGTVGSTPQRVTNKRKQVQEPDSQCPMKVPRKTKKIKEPMRNEEFQTKKDQKDLIDLMNLDITNYQWCFEVCKGNDHFKSLLVNVQPKEIRGPLYKKFKEAQNHFKCAKCATHSTELANSGFIYCEICNSLTHSYCSGLDEKEVKKAKFICVDCSGFA